MKINYSGPKIFTGGVDQFKVKTFQETPRNVLEQGLVCVLRFSNPKHIKQLYRKQVRKWN